MYSVSLSHRNKVDLNTYCNPDYQTTTTTDHVVSNRNTSDKAITQLFIDIQHDVVTKSDTDGTVSLETTTDIKNGSDVVVKPCIVQMATALTMMWILSCDM